MVSCLSITSVSVSSVEFRRLSKKSSNMLRIPTVLDKLEREHWLLQPVDLTKYLWGDSAGPPSRLMSLIEQLYGATNMIRCIVDGC